MIGLRQRDPRRQAPAHLSFVRGLSCVITGGRPVDAAHIRYSEARYSKINPGVGQKPSDFWVVPVRSDLHVGDKNAQHSGNEREFWASAQIDPCIVSMLLWINTGQYEVCEEILANARRGLLKGCFA